MQLKEIKIADIEVLDNVRTQIKANSVAELMGSIKQVGLMQPIGVFPTKSGKYGLIFGHRRLTACKKLGYEKINCVISDDAADLAMQELMIRNMVENLQRLDIGPAELGRQVYNLKTRFEMTEAEIAKRLERPISQINVALDTYQRVPGKLRERISFTGQKNRSNGSIPASVVTAVMSIRRNQNLGAATVETLLTNAHIHHLTSADMINIGRMVEDGATINIAIANIKKIQTYKMNFPAGREEIEKLCKKYKCNNANLMRGILYGEISEKISCPDFLKKK